MKEDAVQKRKDADQKPKKLFSFVGYIWDDGNMSGYGWEYRDMGRMKNQKMSFPDKDEFLSSIRSIVPSAMPIVEDVVNAVYGDNTVTDTIETEKCGKVTFDIYSDGFIDCDFAEILKGARGAPKAWRASPRDFISAMEHQIGSGNSETFKALLGAGTTGEIVIEAEVSE